MEKIFSVLYKIDTDKDIEANFKTLIENLIRKDAEFHIKPRLETYHGNKSVYLETTGDASYELFELLASNEADIKVKPTSISDTEDVSKAFNTMKKAFSILNSQTNVVENSIFYSIPKEESELTDDSKEITDTLHNLINDNTQENSKEETKEPVTELKNEEDSSTTPDTSVSSEESISTFTVDVNLPDEADENNDSQKNQNQASSDSKEVEPTVPENKQKVTESPTPSEEIKKPDEEPKETEPEKENSSESSSKSEEQAFEDSVVSGVELANEEDEPSIIVGDSAKSENIVMNNGKPMDITTGEIVEEVNIPTEKKTEEEKMEALAKEMMSKGSSAVISYGDPEEQPQEDVKAEVSTSEPSTAPTQSAAQPVKDLSTVLTRMNSNLTSQEEVQTELDPTLDIFDDSQLFDDTSSGIDDEIDININDSKKSDIPEGKLYSDKYEYLEVSYNSYQESFNNNSILSGLLHRQKAEVGFDPKANDYLEKIWANHPHRDYISYKTHLANYPEMERIDLPKYWAESYIKLWDKVAPYDKPNEVTSKGILTFDSFVRAKLNRDIPCEPMIKDKIDALYI